MAQHRDEPGEKEPPEQRAGENTGDQKAGAPAIPCTGETEACENGREGEDGRRVGDG